MPNSITYIWIHAIWTTQNRKPIIEPRFSRQLFNRIKEYFQEKGCKVIAINGNEDHVQCLFLLNYKIALSDLIGPAKGISSHYVNYHRLSKDRFAWQQGFYAFSVDVDNLHSIHHSIENFPDLQVISAFEEDLA